ncbi:hypothetical protein CYMTET_6937 [Cymbomonas tetramitiformis]|uniref:Uncharacterized protein n=1 Tax=Cymbomonas tetramitiformis TaxID=36881 RepID=A0AAE0GWL9_9CHLO|nr:hypothetical protein CYMTET_6937 [Cymbomonas tetramitiformis]
MSTAREFRKAALMGLELASMWSAKPRLLHAQGTVKAYDLGGGRPLFLLTFKVAQLNNGTGNLSDNLLSSKLEKVVFFINLQDMESSLSCRISFQKMEYGSLDIEFNEPEDRRVALGMVVV